MPQRGWNVAPGVLEQGDQIVTRLTGHCVLEIEEPAAFDPGTVRQQHQIVDVVVTQYQSRRRYHGIRQNRSPQRQVFLAQPVGERSVPVDQQHRFAEEPLDIIPRQFGGGTRLGRPLQRDQSVYGERIQGGLVGAARQQSGISVVAKILEQQKASVSVFGQHLGGAEAKLAQ